VMSYSGRGHAPMVATDGSTYSDLIASSTERPLEDILSGNLPTSSKTGGSPPTERYSANPRSRCAPEPGAHPCSRSSTHHQRTFK
jgi:hypothetical protein